MAAAIQGKTVNDFHPPKPKLRWYQFSLRTLLLFVLVAGAGLGIYGRKLQKEWQAEEGRRQAEEERAQAFERIYRMLQKLQQAGFYAGFNGDFLHPMCIVSAGSSGVVTDEDLKHLKALNSPAHLALDSQQVTDAGLVHLKGMDNLAFLSLGSTEVSDAGLQYLRALPNLQGLDLPSTKVTDAGLERISGLTNLERLTLNRTQVTDAGLEYLNGLTNLTWLDLSDTQVTDEGVKKLKQALPGSKINR